jgi:hypothetical protein
MTGGTSKRRPPAKSASEARRAEYAVLGAVCAFVIAVYVLSAKPHSVESVGLNAEKVYYNLLVQGFRSSQLNLRREVPPELAKLPDPHDASATSLDWLMEHRLPDLSYYRGKFTSVRFDLNES